MGRLEILALGIRYAKPTGLVSASIVEYTAVASAVRALQVRRLRVSAELKTVGVCSAIGTEAATAFSTPRRDSSLKSSGKKIGRVGGVTDGLTERRGARADADIIEQTGNGFWSPAAVAICRTKSESARGTVRTISRIRRRFSKMASVGGLRTGSAVLRRDALGTGVIGKRSTPGSADGARRKRQLASCA
jgi:hypothetical protein